MRSAEDHARRSNESASKGRGRSGRVALGAHKLHPDQETAAEEIEAALGEALGADVKARPLPGGGYRIELSFDSPEEALGLARRLGVRAVA